MIGASFFPFPRIGFYAHRSLRLQSDALDEIFDNRIVFFTDLSFLGLRHASKPRRVPSRDFLDLLGSYLRLHCSDPLSPWWKTI